MSACGRCRARARSCCAARPGRSASAPTTPARSRTGCCAAGPTGRRPSRRWPDVDLHIAPGERVGLIGRNGAGKTSTLRVLAGIVPLHCGEVALRRHGGQPARVRRRLQPRLLRAARTSTCRAPCTAWTEPACRRASTTIIAFSELGAFIDAPVRTYSTGMFVRLGFSIVAHLDADILLIDEVLAVGDEAFQAKCLARIDERIAAGTTVVFVSHDARAIERVCERVVVLDAGRVRFDGPTEEAIAFYRELIGTAEGALPLDDAAPRTRWTARGRRCARRREAGAYPTAAGP